MAALHLGLHDVTLAEQTLKVAVRRLREPPLWPRRQEELEVEDADSDEETVSAPSRPQTVEASSSPDH